MKRDARHSDERAPGLRCGAGLTPETIPVLNEARYRLGVARFPVAPQVTVCGTFNRGGLTRVADAVLRLLDAGACVLSPVDPTPTKLIDGFWYIASDRHLDRVLVERRHLDASAASDLIWLVAPDGYIGVSAAVEVAYAAGRGVPVFTADHLHEPAIAALVHTVSGVHDALCRIQSTYRFGPSESAFTMLIDPDTGANQAIDAVVSLGQLLSGRECTQAQVDLLTARVYAAIPAPSRNA